VAGAALTTVRIGTAGWALPKALRVSHAASSSVLEQYAALFDAVEINSSFYKPHRRSTFERWRASVPESFRFAVKLSRVITHELGLVRTQSQTAAFMQSASGLDQKLAVILVQLPPSRTFEAAIAGAFFNVLRQETAAHIVCEARNPSWFGSEATAVLESYRVTRVAADPVLPGCEIAAQAHPDFAYFRLHGAPRVYYSPYSIGRLHDVSLAACAAAETWCIFDNTAAGAAWADATALQRLVAPNVAPTG
jgi:uncharacterized protein YecE (DUF72 family)